MAVKSLVRGNIEHFWSIFTKISTFGQGWIQGWKTDGVIIDASAASMLRGRHVRWREGSSGRGPGAQSPEIFWSLLSVQTTRRSNLALAGRRLNRIFMDSYNKFSRLTLKKWENKN